LDATIKRKGSLGPTDGRKSAEKASTDGGQPVVPEFEKPAGVPIDFIDHARLMFDLQVVAFQADLTRITTFMLGREGSTRTYREIGVPDAHHPLTHHRGNEEMIED